MQIHKTLYSSYLIDGSKDHLSIEHASASTSHNCYPNREDGKSMPVGKMRGMESKWRKKSEPAEMDGEVSRAKRNFN